MTLCQQTSDLRKDCSENNLHSWVDWDGSFIPFSTTAKDMHIGLHTGQGHAVHTVKSKCTFRVNLNVHSGQITTSIIRY